MRWLLALVWRWVKRRLGWGMEEEIGVKDEMLLILRREE